MELKVKKGHHIKPEGINELNKIVEEQGGITTQVLLDHASDPNNPLHQYFDWDDTIAAEKWRKEQAGHLLRRVVIEVEINNVPVLVRAFHPIAIESEETKVYYPLNIILSDKEKRMDVVEYALREVEGWAERYQQYTELEPIIKEVKNLKLKFTSPK